MYRKIVTDFWSDPEVEQMGWAAKYVLLYLMTSPLGNMAGCFMVTPKRIAKDTELDVDAVEGALAQITGTNIADYSEETNEVLLKNWPKHNWNMTPNLAKALAKSINAVKRDEFREYLQGEFDKRSTSIESASDKHSKRNGQTPVTVSVSVTDKEITGRNNQPGSDLQVDTGKHGHGEFSNVMLTDKELEQLKAKFPNDYQSRIDDLSYYIGSTGKSYRSHYLTILNWDRKNGPAGKEAKRDEYWAKYD